MRLLLLLAIVGYLALVALALLSDRVIFQPLHPATTVRRRRNRATESGR